jgi:hypothetical protein
MKSKIIMFFLFAICSALYFSNSSLVQARENNIILKAATYLHHEDNRKRLVRITIPSPGTSGEVWVKKKRQ